MAKEANEIKVAIIIKRHPTVKIVDEETKRKSSNS
jgi:hypothetical protein